MNTLIPITSTKTYQYHPGFQFSTFWYAIVVLIPFHSFNAVQTDEPWMIHLAVLRPGSVKSMEPHARVHCRGNGLSIFHSPSAGRLWAGGRGKESCIIHSGLSPGTSSEKSHFLPLLFAAGLLRCTLWKTVPCAVISV